MTYFAYGRISFSVDVFSVLIRENRAIRMNNVPLASIAAELCHSSAVGQHDRRCCSGLLYPSFFCVLLGHPQALTMQRRIRVENTTDNREADIFINKRLIKTLGIDAAFLYGYLYDVSVATKSRTFQLNLTQINNELHGGARKWRKLIRLLVRSGLISAPFSRSQREFTVELLPTTELEMTIYAAQTLLPDPLVE